MLCAIGRIFCNFHQCYLSKNQWSMPSGDVHATTAQDVMYSSSARHIILFLINLFSQDVFLVPILWWIFILFQSHVTQTLVYEEAYLILVQYSHWMHLSGMCGGLVDLQAIRLTWWRKQMHEDETCIRENGLMLL